MFEKKGGGWEWVFRARDLGNSYGEVEFLSVEV